MNRGSLRQEQSVLSETKHPHGLGHLCLPGPNHNHFLMPLCPNHMMMLFLLSGMPSADSEQVLFYTDFSNSIFHFN